MRLFFTQLFVSERKQIAIMAEEKSPVRISLRLFAINRSEMRIIMNNNKLSDFKYGFKKGIPIAMGYIPVSFSFGFMAVNGGLPIWLAVLISVTNLTSSGQLAGTNLIIHGGTLLEITLNTFIINLRYFLMSLSLSQKVEKKTSILHRLIFSFGITDETFALAATEPKALSASYMYGLITGPFWGWTLGTLLGACASSLLPPSLKGAMGIALYAMFIAIIIPPSKKSKPVLTIVIMSIAIVCIIRYIPIFSFISYGFSIIIATVISSAIGAFLFPVSEENTR